jgi:hypothetical protein
MASTRTSSHDKGLRSLESADEEVTLYALKQIIVKLQTSVERLEKNFETHRSDMKKKLEAQTKSLKDLEKTLSQKMKKEIDSLRTYIDGEIGRVVSRIGEIEAKVNVIERKQQLGSEFNYDDTIIVNNLPQKNNENLDHEVDCLLRQGLSLSNVDVVKTKRLNSNNNKPGLVKVQLRDLEEKRRVLQAKFHLKDSDTYGRVHICSSKPYAERVAEMNMKTLLNALPIGKEFRISANGKLIHNNAHRPPGNQQYMPNRPHYNPVPYGPSSYDRPFPSPMFSPSV